MSDLATRLTETSVEYRDEPFTLKAGGESQYYCDLRGGQADIVMTKEVGEMSFAVVLANEIELEVVAAEGLDAYPVQYGLIEAARNRGIKYQRAEVVLKDVPGEQYGRGIHGTRGGVQGKRVLPVDGTTSTGGSLIKAIEMLRESGAIVTDTLTAVDRSNGLAATALDAIGVTFYAAFDFDESTGILIPRYNE